MEIMKIRPLGSKVLVLPKPIQEKTVGGIIIPDTAKSAPLWGDVIAIGKEVKELTPGNICTYGQRAGSSLEVEGVSYLIMDESEIIAKIFEKI